MPEADIGEFTAFESGLLMINDALIGATEFDIFSLNPATCAENWRTHESYPASIIPVNRGAAYLNGMLFRGTEDGRVLAYDFKNGKRIWQTIIADVKHGESVPAAPIAWNCLVFVGNADGEYRLRARRCPECCGNRQLLCRGTRSSNPSPSSGESDANSDSGKGTTAGMAARRRVCLMPQPADAGRVLEGLGACAGIVLARAIIRDIYEQEAAARGLALVMMGMTLAPAISPAFGAYLSEWIDWRAIFLLLGVLGTIIFTATLAPPR